MAARPAKRQRKLVVDSSDEESVPQSINDPSFGRESSLDSEARNPSAASSLSRRSKTTSSSNNGKSPVKPREPSRKNPTLSPVKTGKRKPETASSQSLHSFFKPATEEQRWATIRKTETSSQQDSIIDEAEDADDLIEDDYSSYDEIFDQFKGEDKDASRRNHGVGQSTSKSAPDSFARSDNAVKPPRPAKRFLLPTSPNLQPVTKEHVGGERVTEIDRRPWSERFGPSTLDELAVHKKKVADVRDWLSEAIAGKTRRRMLVLHGPAGSGKTATLSLLSQVLGFGIVEWKSPLGSDHSSSGTKSLSAQFDEFLSQSNVFGNLELDDQSTNNRASQVSSDSATRRIILIEEFPSTLSRTSSALIAFRNSLRRYLASIPPPQSYLFGKASPSNDIPPVVIIVSESLLSTNASMSDNFTMHRLLGPEICNHMSTSTIEFNRIAPTFMYKALDLILKKEARHSLRKRIPSPGVLKKFSELGDVRSAISSLEFLCLRGDDSADWGGRVAAKSKNPSRENTSLTIMEKESLEMVTQRESSLGLFHAVGKVVYNKREGTDSRRREDIIAPPSHLQHFERPRISPVSVEDLMNETGTDVQTFSAALHENYPPSCDGTSFVEHLEDCIHYLSDSDLLGSDSRSVLSASRTGVGTARSRHQGYGASIDTLRQDEISFHVAVRGLLFSLPDPVRRSVGQGALSGRRADAYKMYFPTSLRLWKDTEELSGLVDIWERRLLDTASTDFKITRSQGSEQKGVESWKSLNREQISCSGDDDNSQTVIPTSMSRDDLLLYYLPYLSRIRPNSQHAKELEKITQFRGIVAPTDDVPDDELDDYEPSSSINDWTTDPVKTEFSGRPSETLARSRLDSKPQPPPPVEEAVEKLILSDDDIED